MKRVVEARVKGEKEKEQEMKKKIEEKMAQLEKKNDMVLKITGKLNALMLRSA